MSGGHGGHEHGEGNKKIGLAISILALFLSVAEIMGQKAQTQTLQSNIEASNLWSFFQAKTIRKTVMETAAEELETMAVGAKEALLKDAMDARVKRWKERAAVYESEPGKDGKPGEGRRELMARALDAEKLRDKAGKKHFRFELSSGAFQIAIVLASAAIITGVTILLWTAGGLGMVGIGLLIAGFAA